MKILFYTPHAATWDAASTEAFLADAMLTEKHDVTMVSCDGLFKNYCIAMAARNLRHEAPVERKLEVCAQCQSNRDLIKKRFKFKIVNAELFLTEQDYIEAQKFKNLVTRENYLSLECDGIAVGKYALYEVLIHNKKSSLQFSEAEWNHYRDALENTVLSLKAARGSFTKIKPDRFVVFSSMYSSNQVWKKEAQRQGILPIQIHGPAGVSDVGVKFTLMRDLAIKGVPYADAVRNWPEVVKKSATAKSIRAVTSHFKHVMGAGAFVYSPKPQGRNIRDFYSLDKNKPLFVASLSSQDEVIASEVIGYPPFEEASAFPSQVEWIRELLLFFSKKPEWQLLIRPHPRMYPTTNNKVISEEAQAILNLCKELPGNVKINPPPDGISMYEVLQEADVILNAWSSVGAEAAVFGLPVVQYKALTWFPDEINQIALSQQEYFLKMNEALNTKIDIVKIQKIYRWLALLYETGVLDLSKNFYFRGHSIWKKVLRRVFIPKLFLEKKKSVKSAFESAELSHYSLDKENIDLVRSVLGGEQSSIIDFRIKSYPNVNPEVEKAEIKKSLKTLLALSSNHKKTRLTQSVDKVLKLW